MGEIKPIRRRRGTCDRAIPGIERLFDIARRPLSVADEFKCTDDISNLMVQE